MSELSLPEQEVLKRVVAKPELRPHFFSKIKKLKWFDAIVAEGLLEASENPRPQTTKDQYITVSSWPVLEYLVSTSALLREPENRHFAEKFIQVIREITDFAISKEFSNHRSWWQFSKIIKHVPVDLIIDEDFSRIQFWLSDPYDRSLIGNELGVWLKELLANFTSDKKHHALSLMNVIFDVRSVKNRYSEEKQEAVLPIDNYHADKLIDEIASIAGEEIGLEAVQLFEAKLQAALDIEGNDGWSVFWRPAIEPHEQNRNSKDAQVVVLKALRDSMVAFVNKNLSEAESKLNELLQSESQVKRRIGIHVASESFKCLSEETVSNVLTVDNFKDPFRHEIWRFLNTNFSEMRQNHQDEVISIISGMSVEDNDGTVAPQATAYKQSQWLSAVKDANDQTKALYRQSVSVAKTEPDHPDFACYTTSGPIGHESPIAVPELKEMLQDSEELIRYLNAYNYVGHFDEPDLEGLVKAFRTLVKEIFEDIPKYLPAFLDLKLHFVHEIYTVFHDAWQDKSDVDWDLFWFSIMDFSLALISEKSFWSNQTDLHEDAFVGNRDWVVTAMSRLIESGCKSDDHAFPLTCIQKSKEVLECLLDCQEGEEFTKSSDAVTLAINSPRGRCLEAYINLALFECRNKQKDSRDHENIWASYEPIFSNELSKKDKGEFEFATLVAHFLPNFRYLSASWVESSLPSIFDVSNQQAWLCAVQGFSYVGRFDEQIYNYLKASEDFIRVLDSEELKERVEDRYIQLIVLGYFYEKERVNDENSLIGLLLERNKPEELSAVVWFIWTLRNDRNPRVIAIVKELFPELLECIDLNSPAGRKLASRLCTWADFFDEFDEDVIGWLHTIASYSEEDFNASYIMDALARLSQSDAMQAYEIWTLVLRNRTYDYPDRPIKTIFQNLVALGADGVRAAKDIAGRYHEFGTSRPLEWLNEMTV